MQLILQYKQLQKKYLFHHSITCSCSQSNCNFKESGKSYKTLINCIFGFTNSTAFACFQADSQDLVRLYGHFVPVVFAQDLDAQYLVRNGVPEVRIHRLRITSWRNGYKNSGNCQWNSALLMHRK